MLPGTHENEVEKALHEADHVARVFEEVERVGAESGSFDVLHDHCGYTALAMADRIDVRMVHTLHGPFAEDNSDFYVRHGSKVRVVAISETQAATAPEGVEVTEVVPNPVDAGVPLTLGGVVQPGQEAFFAAEVEPHLDDDAVGYVGEVGGEQKKELFASDSVRDGETGFLVNDEHEMAAALERLGEIDPAACRDEVLERHDVAQVAAAYEDVYHRARAASPRGGARVT